MLLAAWWGFVGGAALVLGAVIALRFPVSQRAIGLIMAFGAGVLISAVAFELTFESFNVGGSDATALGLAAGALCFFFGDRIIDRRGGDNRKRSGGQQTSEGTGMPIVLGALLDGIPESAAIGISLIGGGKVAGSVVAAVFLSNVPESLSATTGLQKSGRSPRFILLLWLGVAAVSTLAAVLGYQLLGGASENVVAAVQAFAAGAILTMLADTMMPESFEHGGSEVGLLTVLGFALASYLSTLS